MRQTMDYQQMNNAAYGVRYNIILLLVLICCAAGVLLALIGPLKTLGAVAVVTVLWLIVTRPYFGIISYIILEYIRPGDLAPVLDKLHLARVVLVLTAFGWLRIWLALNPRKFTWSKQSSAIVGLIFMMLVSVCTAVWPGRALIFSVDGAKTAVIFLLISNIVNTRKKLFFLFWLLSLLAFRLAGQAILNYLATGNPAKVDTGGFLGDENDLSLALLVIMPITALLLRISEKIWQKMISLTVLVAVSWGIILTFSRGGFIGLMFVLAALAWTSNRKWLVMASVAIAVIGMWMVTPDSYHARIGSISHYEKDGSAMGRILAWKAAGNMFRDRPFFGVGPGNFETAYGLLYRPPGSEHIWRTAHSIYYQCIGELGAFGCLFFALIIYYTISELRRIQKSGNFGKEYEHDKKIATAMLIAMGAYLVSGTFLSALYYPHPYLIAAFTTALSDIRMNNY